MKAVASWRPDRSRRASRSGGVIATIVALASALAVALVFGGGGGGGDGDESYRVWRWRPSSSSSPSPSMPLTRSPAAAVAVAVAVVADDGAGSPLPHLSYRRRRRPSRRRDPSRLPLSPSHLDGGGGGGGVRHSLLRRPTVYYPSHTSSPPTRKERVDVSGRQSQIGNDYVISDGVRMKGDESVHRHLGSDYLRTDGTEKKVDDYGRQRQVGNDNASSDGVMKKVDESGRHRIGNDSVGSDVVERGVREIGQQKLGNDSVSSDGIVKKVDESSRRQIGNDRVSSDGVERGVDEIGQQNGSHNVSSDGVMKKLDDSGRRRSNIGKPNFRSDGMKKQVDDFGRQRRIGNDDIISDSVTRKMADTGRQRQIGNDNVISEGIKKEADEGGQGRNMGKVDVSSDRMKTKVGDNTRQRHQIGKDYARYDGIVIRRDGGNSEGKFGEQAEASRDFGSGGDGNGRTTEGWRRSTPSRGRGEDAIGRHVGAVGHGGVSSTGRIGAASAARRAEAAAADGTARRNINNGGSSAAAADNGRRKHWDEAGSGSGGGSDGAPATYAAAAASPPRTYRYDTYATRFEEEERVVGGREAEEGRYPYLAAVFRERSSSKIQQICGGSLVSSGSNSRGLPAVVLSSAHCVTMGAKIVRLGVHNLKDTFDEDDGMEEYEIIDKVIHPRFDGVEYDFVLFVLGGPSQYDHVDLNEASKRPRVGRNLYIVGWGKMKFKGEESTVPREAVVKTMSNDVCDEMYDKSLEVSDAMLCCASPGRDACEGDSGGPLIIKGDEWEEDLLVGVVSTGIECANPHYPGVYARVSSVIRWIETSLGRIEGEHSGGGGGKASKKKKGKAKRGKGKGKGKGTRHITGDDGGSQPDDDAYGNGNDDNGTYEGDDDGYGNGDDYVDDDGSAGGCADAEDYDFVDSEDEERTCEWVEEEERCDEFDEQCPETCGLCDR